MIFVDLEGFEGFLAKRLKNDNMNIVLLAAGDFPMHNVPMKALGDADLVVCCDSAYKQFSFFNYQLSIPFVVIGDGDSLSDADKQDLGDRWIHVAEQEYNDLHKAMQWVMMNGERRTENGERRTENGERRESERDRKGANGLSTENGERKTENGKQRVSILGATGKREDHTLGNIGYLVSFAEEYPDVEIEMLTDYGRFVALKGSRTFHSFPGQQVSVFSMDPECPIYSEGLRWPLDGLQARRWWQATLNEALASEFSLRSEGWLVVFQSHEGK